ncbi:universal stress protein [Natronorubrum sp. FCH18a]|uniref:universal stress protein n=1 Tax=Natronorubrum sp. FCH18a TaxID=3447018 RepID=UPI003F514E0E
MVIIAAVDRSDRADLVINQAEVLAVAFNDEIHVVHVLTRSDFVDLERTSMDETGSAMDPDQVRKVAEDIASDAAANLTTPYETIGLIGDPADQIVKYADEEDARYIVVTGRKRSPAGKVIFGSVAQSILLNAESPVVSSIEP